MKQKYKLLFNEFIEKPNTYIELYISYPFMLNNDMINFINKYIDINSHTFKFNIITLKDFNNYNDAQRNK